MSEKFFFGNAGLFLSLLLGPVNVRATRSDVRLKVKEEYNAFRVRYLFHENCGNDLSLLPVARFSSVTVFWGMWALGPTPARLGTAFLASGLWKLCRNPLFCCILDLKSCGKVRSNTYCVFQDRTALLFLAFPVILLVLKNWWWNGCFPALPVQCYQV